MTRNKFITYVDLIKRMFRTIEYYYWGNKNDPNRLSYGSFYETCICLLAETFPNKSHQQMLIGMFKGYQRDLKFTREYNTKGKFVRTPIELYDLVMKDDL